MDMLNKAKASLANGLMIGAAVSSIIGGAIFRQHGINDSWCIGYYPVAIVRIKQEAR